MNHDGFVDSYARYVNSMERSLKLLNDDLSHLSRGGRITYLIDFSEVFFFLHPFADLNIETSITRIPLESTDDALAREQIALQFAINHLDGPKVLLPPYLVELRDHIRLLRNAVEMSDHSRRQVLQDRIVDALLSNEHYPTLKSSVETTRNLASIGKEHHRDFLEFVKSEFRPLYLVLTMSPYEAESLVATVSRLFSRKKLTDYFSEYHADQNQFDQIKEIGLKWYDLLRERDSQKKDYARYLDGMACAYIDHLTNEGARTDHRFLFISRSHRMTRVFNSDRQAVLSIRKAAGGQFRDLDYLMTSLRFSRQSSSAALQEVDEALKRIVQLKEGLKYARAHAHKDDIQYLERQVIALSNSKENLSIALGNKGVNIDADMALVPQLSEALNQVLQKIYTAVTTDPVIGDSLQEENRILSKSITQQFNYLRLMFDRKELDRTAQWSLPEGSTSGVIELLPLRSELPITIAFSDPNAIRIAKNIVGDALAARKVKKWRTNIQTLLNDSSGGTDIVILRSYLFALLDSYDAACDEIDIALHRDPPRTGVADLLLLKMLYARRAGRTTEGIRAYVENQRVADKDPRLLRELSVLVWQCVKSSQVNPETDTIVEIEQLIEETPTVEYAIRLARRVLSSRPTDVLKAQTLNSLAYYLAEMYTTSEDFRYLEEAKQKVIELVDFWPCERWISRFYHTEGWVAYLFANAKVDQAENIDIALSCLGTAVREKRAPIGELRIWRDHLKLAKGLHREM